MRLPRDLSGDDLSLQREATIVELLDRRIADPDEPLVGPTWRVDSLIGGQVVSSVPGGVAASLTFQPDGRVAVDTGCNTGSATYSVDGTTIRLGPIGLTKRACVGPAGDLEPSVLGVVQLNPLSYAIEAKP